MKNYTKIYTLQCALKTFIENRIFLLSVIFQIDNAKEGIMNKFKRIQPTIVWQRHAMRLNRY